jgi:hypothetical protein
MPLSFDLKALLAMGLTCAVLHLAQAAQLGARIATQRNVSWFSGFFGWYWVLTTAARAVLSSLLVLGVVAIWTRRPIGRRCTAWSAVGIVALGLVEAAVSVVSFFIGPQRATELGGVMASIARTFMTHYCILLLLLYVLNRPDNQHDRASIE